MKVRCIDDCDIDIGQITNRKVYDVLKEGGLGYLIIDDLNIRKYLRKDRFEIVKEENKMKKTFREVIADIKEGEVWESENTLTQIYTRNDVLIIDFKEEVTTEIVKIPADAKFRLKRKEYSFDEAFKAYEEGEVVESEDGFIYKKINGQDCVCSDEARDWVKNDGGFSVKEIRGKWYIND